MTCNDPAPPEENAKASSLVGIIFTLVLLSVGLGLGTQGTLELTRDAQGNITATQSWRFIGRYALFSRSVNNVTDAKVMEQENNTLEERQNPNHNISYEQRQRYLESLTIIGDTIMLWPEKGDTGAMRGFITDPTARTLTLTAPIDLRRKIGSWCCLGLFGLIITSGLWKLVRSRPASGQSSDEAPMKPNQQGTMNS